MRKETRHNLQMIGEALLLLVVTLGVLVYFSHKVLREEGVRNAEQTLEGTMQHIDNILLSVEQATGNIYYDLLQHLDEPERMYTYSRELVLSNPISMVAPSASSLATIQEKTCLWPMYIIRRRPLTVP